MKLGKLINPSFQAAIRKIASQELPLVAAYKLKGILKRGDEELAKYDEVRKAALITHGAKNEDGTLILDENQAVRFTEGSQEKFAAELNALLNLDIELGKIKVSELGNNVNVTADDLVLLEDLLVD